MIRIWLPLALLLGLVYPVSVQADELRPGYLSFSERAPGAWSLVWKAPMRGGVTPQTQPRLPPGCSISGPVEREMAELAVTTRYSVRCRRDVAGQSIGLSNLGGAQTDILLRVAPLGRPVQTMRLTAAVPEMVIATKPDRWQVASTYFAIGVEHILFGFDHLLFVIAMVLLVSGGLTVVKAVTAFTIAHSITLIGTTMGFLGLPQAPVEAVIALSIMCLAVEIVKKREGETRLSERIPWLVAFLFGLLHGFGFAGALKEIGLPETEVPAALLTFNLGVEAGQLAVVTATLAAIAMIRRLAPNLLRPATVVTSYAIGSVASFWLIERMIV